MVRAYRVADPRVHLLEAPGRPYVVAAPQQLVGARELPQPVENCVPALRDELVETHDLRAPAHLNPVGRE